MATLLKNRATFYFIIWSHWLYLTQRFLKILFKSKNLKWLSIEITNFFCKKWQILKTFFSRKKRTFCGNHFSILGSVLDILTCTTRSHIEAIGPWGKLYFEMFTQKLYFLKSNFKSNLKFVILCWYKKWISKVTKNSVNAAIKLSSPLRKIGFKFPAKIKKYCSLTFRLLK